MFIKFGNPKVGNPKVGNPKVGYPPPMPPMGFHSPLIRDPLFPGGKRGIGGVGPLDSHDISLGVANAKISTQPWRFLKPQSSTRKNHVFRGSPKPNKEWSLG